MIFQTSPSSRHVVLACFNELSQILGWFCGLTLGWDFPEQMSQSCPTWRHESATIEPWVTSCSLYYADLKWGSVFNQIKHLLACKPWSLRVPVVSLLMHCYKRPESLKKGPKHQTAPLDSFELSSHVIPIAPALSRNLGSFQRHQEE